MHNMFVVPVCEKRRGGKVDGQTKERQKEQRQSYPVHVRVPRRTIFVVWAWGKTLMHYKMEEGDREVSSFNIYPVGSVYFLPHGQSFRPKNGKKIVGKRTLPEPLAKKTTYDSILSVVKLASIFLEAVWLTATVVWEALGSRTLSTFG